MLRGIGTAAAAAVAAGVMGATPAQACFDDNSQNKKIAELIAPGAAEKLTPAARGLTGADAVVLSARRSGTKVLPGTVKHVNEKLIGSLTVTDLRSVESAFLTHVVLSAQRKYEFCCCCCCCCAVAQVGPRPVRIR